ncbi:hypothetical protein FCV25MIE_21330 [Fagus crenata]
MISNRGLKQGSRGSNSINKLRLDYVEDSAIEYGGKWWISVSLRDDKQQRIEARIERLQLHQQAKLGLCRRLVIEYGGKWWIFVSLRDDKQQRIEARIKRLELHQQAKLGLCRRLWYADLHKQKLCRLSMEENGGSLSHSEMISNRGLKQGSRGSNSINKLSLDYVENSGIESYIHYQEIERKRKIAVLKYELSKLKREASKLQLEAKLRRELL